MTGLFRHLIPQGRGWQGVRHLVGAGGPGPEAARAFEEATGYSYADMGVLLGEAAPLLTTLALLGYDVPYIDVECHDHTARMHLTGGAVLLSHASRPPGPPEEPHRLRLWLEKAGAGLEPGAVPPPISVSALDVEDYRQSFRAWWSKPTAEIIDHYVIHALYALGGGDPASRRTSQPLPDMDVVLDVNLFAFVAAGMEGPVTLQSGLTGQMVPTEDFMPQFRRYLPKRAEHLILIHAQMILAPVTAFFQWHLGRATEAWFLGSAPGTSGAAMAPAGSLPPGRLGLLDPSHWHDGPLLTAQELDPFDRGEIIESLGYLRQSYGRIARAMAEPGFVGEVPMGPSQWADPRYIDKPGADFYRAGLASHRAPFQAKPLPEEAVAPVSAASVLVQRLTEGPFQWPVPDRAGSSDPERPDRLYSGMPQGPDQLRDPLRLEGLLGLVRPLDASQALIGPRTISRRVAEKAHQAILHAGGWAPEAYAVSFSIAGDNHLIALENVVNAGLFTVSHLYGLPGADMELYDEEYDVVATWDGGAIRLRLPDYLHAGIRLSLTDQSLGYTLEEAVTWAYMPAPEPAEEPAVAETRAALGGTSTPRLLIIAGPGVQIERLEWPPTVEMAVIRLQDAGAVPPQGTPINPLIYTASRSVNVAEIVTEEQLTHEVTAITAGTLSPHQSVGQLFYDLGDDAKYFNVVLKPQNVPAIIPDGPIPLPLQTGLTILVPGTAVSMTGDPGAPDGHYRGPTRQAMLHLTVDPLSGTERFTYQLCGRRVAEWREIEQGTFGWAEHIGVLALVHSTHVFPDSAVTGGAESLATRNAPLSAAFWRARGPGAVMADVAPQGGRLDFLPADWESTHDIWDAIFGLSESDVPDARGHWHDLTDGLPLERESNVLLQHSMETFNSAQAAEFVANVTFAGQLLVDVGLGLIPGVGDAADVLEFAWSLYSGTDRWGQPVTHAQQVLMLGAIALPFVSNRALRAMADVADPSDVNFLHGVRD
ncbi:hypothetical protein [Pseudoroseicyclus sp. CXY001]|uniref:hypothetical protein n=1 Tax=Pseudoroseicyclus sp. CXY001 TaxID=3242492 RepID=UPI00358DBF64